MVHSCRKCGTILLIGENATQNMIDRSNYICKSCHNEMNRINGWSERANRRNGHLPMSENAKCASFLGIHVAERVLYSVFKDVELMSYGNRGYDFICNSGKKIDVKSSCLHINHGKSLRWMFGIRCNTIADYFLCIAFDNRDDLTPLHIWLIPGNVLNHKYTTSISETTITKWDEYKLDINKVITCCDILKGDKE